MVLLRQISNDSLSFPSFDVSLMNILDDYHPQQGKVI